MTYKAATDQERQKKQARRSVKEWEQFHAIYLSTFIFSLYWCTTALCDTLTVEFSLHKKIYVYLGSSTIVNKR